MLSMISEVKVYVFNQQKYSCTILSVFVGFGALWYKHLRIDLLIMHVVLCVKFTTTIRRTALLK